MFGSLEDYLADLGDKDRFELLGSKWTKFEDGQVYLHRHSQVVLDGGMHPCVTLASVTRPCRSSNVSRDPSVRSSGFMERLMDLVESRAFDAGKGVLCESVLNEFLPMWLLRRGYRAMPETYPTSYFRPHP